VFKDKPEHSVLLACKGFRGRPEHKDKPEHSVLLACKGFRGRPEHKEYRGYKGTRGFRV
jgi:hypothetical protein